MDLNTNATNMYKPKKRTWLKVMRTEKEMNQKDVAQACGINQTLYSYIERGIMLPDESAAKSLAAFFGFDWTIFYK